MSRVPHHAPPAPPAAAPSVVRAAPRRVAQRPAPLRVLLIIPQALDRMALVALLGAEADLTLVGALAEPRQVPGWRPPPGLAPDVVLLQMLVHPTAAAERGVAACSDGRDNDCDGVSDCNVPDCRLTSDPNAECCNGRDDNRNGVIDEFACVCASNAQCAGVGAGGTFPSNTCWNTTFGVCAPRCTVLGGQAFCDAFFRGSRCNTATGECVR